MHTKKATAACVGLLHNQSTPKVMPPILLCWLTTSEVDAGGVTAEVWSGKMACDMGLHTKQRCVIEFLHAEKIAPINIQRCLLNIYYDQTVDVSTGRRLVVHFIFFWTNDV
jgi:hypothetical protein